MGSLELFLALLLFYGETELSWIFEQHRSNLLRALPSYVEAGGIFNSDTEYLFVLH